MVNLKNNNNIGKDKGIYKSYETHKHIRINADNTTLETVKHKIDHFFNNEHVKNCTIILERDNVIWGESVTYTLRWPDE